MKRAFQPAWTVWIWRVQSESTLSLVPGQMINSHSSALYTLFLTLFSLVFFLIPAPYTLVTGPFLRFVCLFWNQMPPSFTLSLHFKHLFASESCDVLTASQSIHFLKLFRSTILFLASLSIITENGMALLLLRVNEKYHWHFDTLKKQIDTITLVVFCYCCCGFVFVFVF